MISMISAQNAKWPKVDKQIIKLVTTNPSLGSRSISKILTSKGNPISHVAVNSFLNRVGGETYDRRLNLMKSYSGPGRLVPEIRKEVVLKAKQGQSISMLSKEYHISRDTIYRWVEIFDSGEALCDRYKKGDSHPNTVINEYKDRILNKVKENPSLTAKEISNTLPISSWTVWNFLKNEGLHQERLRNEYAMRFKEAKEQKEEFVIPSDTVRTNLNEFVPNMLPAPPPKFSFLKTIGLFAITSWATIFLTISLLISFKFVFAFTALLMGTVFFLYSVKYYLVLGLVLSYSQNDKKRSIPNFFKWVLGIKNSPYEINNYSQTFSGLNANIDATNLAKESFVSVHVALFNESHVVERLMRAVTSFDYKEYEVILADDSNDKTTEIIDSYLKSHLFKNENINSIKGDGWYMNWLEIRPGLVLKHLHRDKRDGFKGKALELALKLTNPKASFVSVFDADFVPYPDTLQLFLKYFQEASNEKIAVVQGYQWHVLNKSENWITRGVRSEYSGSYVVERSGVEIYNGLKQISGSVYMIKKNVLEKIGWGTSITEDFELTLKLYESGYKVLYTPYIQAPAECVSTLTRLVRQRMRWAEGHSQNVKKMFFRLMGSPKLSFSEKIEFLFLSPYYLQAFFFLVGTFFWVVSETVFHYRLPFWTEVWGWSLVLTNMISLPLLNGVGLFLEEGDNKDFSGLFSFIALSYILVPFQAFASVKGFLESTEGPWFRTPKTGRITDILTRGKFMRFVQDILPVSNNSPYLSLNTASTKFENFRILPKRIRYVGHLFTVILMASVVTLTYFYPYINIYNPKEVMAQGFGLIGANDVSEKSGSLKILNLHSHPKKGDIWKVNFETRGIGTLTVSPDDDKTNIDIRFVTVLCGDNKIIPDSINGNVVRFDNWDCPKTGSVSNLIVNQGDHAIRVQFGLEMMIAYNGSPATSTSANATAYSFQRKTWYDGTRYWSSFYSGSDIDFYYSTNSGANWTQDTSASIAVNTNDYSIWADASNAYVSYTTGAVTNEDNLLTSGLVGYWKMNETSWDGTPYQVVDSSPTANNGRAYNSVTTTSSGYFNYAGNFDGSDDYVGIDSVSALNPGSGSWTMSAWIKPPNSNQNGLIFQKTTGYSGYFVGVSGDLAGTAGKKIIFYYSDGAGNTRAGVSTSDVADGNWHHVSVVFNSSGGTVTLFVDGSSVSFTATNAGSWPTVTNSANPSIGGFTAFYFNGPIDDMRIYNQALSSTDVAILAKPGYDTEVRKATSYPGTSFSWGDPTVAYNGTSSSDYYQYPVMTQDTNSKIWLGASKNSSSTYTFNARRSSSASDITAWDSSTSLNSSANSNKYGVIVPRTSGNAQAVYVDGTSISSKNYTSGAWDGSATSVATGVSGLTTSISMVADSSGNTHLVYIDSNNNTVYREYTSSWQTAVTLDSNSGNAYPSITINSSNNDLYAFWIRGNHIYYKRGVSTYTSGNWDSVATDWKSSGTNTWVTSNYSASDAIFATWTSGTGSPYTVNWDILSIPEAIWFIYIFGPFLPLLVLFRNRKISFDIIKAHYPIKSK